MRPALVLTFIVWTALWIAECRTAHAQTPLDLAALVEQECGPEGYRRETACKLTLPKGHFTFGETVLGRCDGPSGTRNGLSLIGQGASPFATVPYFPTSATVLEYDGPPGGTALRVCGSHFYLRDVAFDCEGAGVCLQLVAENSRSAIMHVAEVERFSIQRGDLGISIRGAGEGFNDQTDYISIRKGTIRGVARCFDLDSQQAVGIDAFHIDCASWQEGWTIRNGSFHADQIYAGQLAAPDGNYLSEYVGMRLGRSAGPSHMFRHQVSLVNSHFEISHGRHFVDDSGSTYAVRIASGLWQMQHPAARVWNVITSRTRAPLVLDGLTISATGGKGQSARICHVGGPLVANGVSATPSTSGIVWGCE